MSKPRLVLGVIGNDIHVVANRVLERGLKNNGYTVCNLGVNSMPDDFVFSSLEFGADAVIINSINGEGEVWAKTLRAKFDNVDLKNIFLYIGGNLGIGDKPKKNIEKKFLDYGFNRAYHLPESLSILLEDLKKDFPDVV